MEAAMMDSAVIEAPGGKSTLENVLHVRQLVASARFIPIPRGQKAPRLKDWPQKATRELAMLESWFGPGGLYEDHSYGVCNVVAIDVDVKGGASGVESFRALEVPREVWDSAFRVKTPSGGYHVIFSLPEGVEARSHDGWRPGIDVKAGLSGQVVGAGCISIREGAEVGSYIPMNDTVAAPCPQILVDLIGLEHCQTRKSASKASVVELDTDDAVARATAFLEARRPAVEGEGGDIFTLLTAQHVIDFGISADMCHDLMAEYWNGRCSPPWELEGPNSLRSKVDSAMKSRDHAPGIASPEAEFKGVSIPAPEYKPRPRPKRLWLGDKSLNTSQQWLMWNRLPRTGTAAISGPSQSGKTFLALDLAACLGSGRDWLGVAGDEKVGTIVLSAEGIGGLPARLKGYDYTGPVVAMPIGPLHTDKAKAALVTEIEEMRDELRSRFDARLGLVVIDTLTAAGLLLNENDNSEIGRMLKYLEEIATTFSCLCLTIHHPPKSGGDLRGGYALRAGFDLVVEVFQRGNERFVECTKNRDGEAGSWGSFVLERIVVEPDPTGCGRDTTTQRVVYGTSRRSEKLFTFIDGARVDAILEAVGSSRHRKSWSSDKGSIIEVIGDATGLDTNKRAGRETAKAYLKAMLERGNLRQVEDRDEHRNRVLYIEATGGDVDSPDA